MKRGFSLVELSIVLVILGLLTGGILAGQSLIRAAELKRSVTKINQYITALYTFRSKYFALPGDMTNAKTFWPTCGDVPTSIYCNGNGDGQMGGFVNAFGQYQNESTRVFEHLGRAGLVEGSYDGTQTSDMNMLYPLNPLLGYSVISYSNDGSWFPDNKIGNTFEYMQSTPKVKTEDIWNLDTKMDDGNGLRGSFRILWEEIPDPDGCINISSGAYQFTKPADNCHIFIFLSV